MKPVFLVQTPHHAATARKGSYPRYLNLIDAKATAVQREIRREGSGGYETDMQATLLAVCEWQGKDCVFYDIGAHLGYYSAMAATLFASNNIQITAFEPTPDTADLARKIRDTNGLRYNITESAVADTPGSVELFLSPKAETSNSLNQGFREGSTPVTVRCTTIDAHIADGGTAPDFIKIDVETFEHAVLAGGMDTFATHRPAITCELLPTGDFAVTRPVLERLEALNYRFYQISPGRDWPVHTTDSVEQHLNGGLRDWLFLPDDMPEDLPDMIATWRDALAGYDKTTCIYVNTNWSPGRLFKALKARRSIGQVWG